MSFTIDLKSLSTSQLAHLVSQVTTVISSRPKLIVVFNSRLGSGFHESDSKGEKIMSSGGSYKLDQALSSPKENDDGDGDSVPDSFNLTTKQLDRELDGMVEDRNEHFLSLKMRGLRFSY